jgi:hypothetical protein
MRDYFKEASRDKSDPNHSKWTALLTNAFLTWTSQTVVLFKNELLFYVRKRDMIGPDFNCTAMMVPVGDAVTNDRDAPDVQSERKVHPSRRNLWRQDGDEQKIYRRMLVYKVDTFVAVCDDGRTHTQYFGILFLHSYRITLTTDDLRKRVRVYKTFKNWRIPSQSRRL